MKDIDQMRAPVRPVAGYAGRALCSKRAGYLTLLRDGVLKAYIYFLLGSLIAGLAGCERNQRDEAQELVRKSETGAAPLVIPQTDLLGRFGGVVHDIAFWYHGEEPFRGGVLASNGTAGLVLVTVEGEATTPVAGNFVGDIAVTYLTRGAGTPDISTDGDREGAVIRASQLSLIAAFDMDTDDANDSGLAIGPGIGPDIEGDIDRETGTGKSTGQDGVMRFFTVDEKDNSFLELTLPGAADFVRMPQPQAYCFNSARGQNSHRLVVFEASGKARQILITLDEMDDLTVEEGPVFEVKDAIACVNDPHQGYLYIATRSGDILEIEGVGQQSDTLKEQSEDGKTGHEGLRPNIRYLKSLQKPIVDMGIILASSATPGVTKSIILALTQEPEGVMGYVVGKIDGEISGVFNLEAFDDIEGVSQADGFAVGSGNLGGVYRRGALAVIDSGDEGALKLAPLSALSTLLPDILSGSGGSTITPREALKDAMAEPIGPPIRLIPDEVLIDPR